MTYPTNPIQPTPKPKGRGLKVALIVTAVLVGLCGFGSLIAVLAASSDAPSASLLATPAPNRTTVPDPGLPPVADTPATPAPSRTLAASDVKLTVKVTDKQCFGSAGCNVQWDVKAGWPEDKVRDGVECDVTYDVRGLSDPQVGTLTIRDDGQYLSDTFNFGQTRKRSDKVTLKVTEIECR